MKCIDHYLLKKCFVILVALLFNFITGVQKPCTVFTAACVRKEKETDETWSPLTNKTYY